MKLTPEQLEYIKNSDWVESMPFKQTTEPYHIEGRDTGYTKSFEILETVRGDRLILRAEFREINEQDNNTAKTT